MISRERILTNALDMFNRHGVKAVTMDDIAKELRISKRTLYEHFDNKEDILICCINSKINQGGDFTGCDKSLMDLLLEYSHLMAMLQQSFGHHCFCDIRRYHGSIYTSVLKKLSEYALLCRGSVRSGIDQGFVRRDVTPDFVYVTILEHLSKMFSDSELLMYDASYNDYMAQKVVAFARGISTIKGRAYIDQKIKKTN